MKGSKSKTSNRKQLRQIIESRSSTPAQRRDAQKLLDLSGPFMHSLIPDGDDDDVDEEEAYTTVETLLTQAEEFLYQLNTQEAKKCVDKALEAATNTILRAEVLNVAARILMEESAPPEEVVKLLREAEMLNPNTSYERHLNLGQFTEAFESLDHYKKAIEVLQRDLQTNQSHLTTLKQKFQQKKTRALREEINEIEEAVNDAKATISMAMTSISELYTTDLCDEDDAEEQCTKYILQAVEVDPGNIEGFRLLGNLRLIQQNKEEAIKHTMHACQLLINAIEQDDPHIPPFVSRFDLARQLYELRCFSDATALFCGLLHEETQIAELWYYAAASSLSLAEELTKGTNSSQEEINDILSAAAQYIFRALHLLKQAPDDELYNDIQPVLNQLNAMGHTQDIAKEQLQQMMAADDDESALDSIELPEDDNMDD